VVTGAELLLHPVRLRIVKAFLGDRALTTGQLASELNDIPTGSLYRHVALLAHAEVLQVVAEQRVRGALERTYALRVAAAQLQPSELASMTPADHAHGFMAFVASALSDFDRYVATNPTDLVQDGTGYRSAAAWLDDAELTEFIRDLLAVIRPRLAIRPGQGRRRRILYGVVLPASGGPS
jgi:hypothetical protein